MNDPSLILDLDEARMGKFIFHTTDARDELLRNINVTNPLEVSVSKFKMNYSGVF